MNDTSDNLFRRVHALAQGQLDGELTPARLEELESLLLESAAARRLYAAYLEQTACLRWLCLEEFPTASEPAMPRPVDRARVASGRRMTIPAAIAGLACALALSVFGWQFYTRFEPFASANKNLAQRIENQSSGEPIAEQIQPPVATITGLRGVRWSPEDEPNRLLSRCYVGKRLQLQEGAAELTFDAGVQLTVFGPADFQITSSTSIRCKRGRVTTLANERGKGFTIETPQAKVVDLGTQFGLSISEEGETQVVVFQGSIDLTYNSPDATGESPSRRLEQGDALSLNKAGGFERLVSVERNQFLAGVDGVHGSAREPVIVDVRDNIRKAESIKSYQIVHGGLQEDALCFVDRNHEWNGMDAGGLPVFLVGADYIMPFNDDKFVRDLEITVRLARPATLYVFLDNNMEVPDWLREGFTDTGLDIGLDGAKTEWHEMNSLAVGAGRSVDFPFSVWKREVKRPETVTLGGIEPPNVRSRGFNMYGIAAVAAE